MRRQTQPNPTQSNLIHGWIQPTSMSGVTSERYRYTITCQPGQLACVYHVRGDVECLSECHRHGFRRLMKTSVYVDVDVMYFACAADHLHLEPVGGQRNIIETREYSRSATAATKAVCAQKYTECHCGSCRLRGAAVERWSLTDELSLSCARPTAAGYHLCG